MISAVLDACVLYSASLRDFLLHLADDGLVEPFWSEEIQNEWTRNLLQNRPDLKLEKLDRTRREMDLHFPLALVRGYESIVPSLTLPDPNDRHVLAVAIHVKAEYIVTFDLNDFPKAALLPHGIKAVSPEEFVMQLVQNEPRHVLQTVREHRSNLTRPSKTVDEYIETLEKHGLPKTATFLREHQADI